MYVKGVLIRDPGGYSSVKAHFSVYYNRRMYGSLSGVSMSGDLAAREY